MREPPPSRPVPTRPPRWQAWSLLTLSTAVLVVMWVMLALYSGRQHAWMAIVVALDVAWVLRFGGWRPGPLRAALAACATGAIVVVAQWGIIAGHIGAQFGLDPWASSLKLGMHHAWFMAQLANGPLEWSLVAAGLVVAVLAAR